MRPAFKKLFQGSTTEGDKKAEEQKRTPNKLQKKRPPAVPVEAAGGSSSREGEQRAPNKLQKKRSPAVAVEPAGAGSSRLRTRRAAQEKRDLDKFQSMLDSVTPDENSENSLEKFQEVARTVGRYLSPTVSVRRTRSDSRTESVSTVSRQGSEDGMKFMKSYLINQKFGDPAHWMASFKTLQLIEFVLDAHPSGFYWTADLIVRAASQLVVLLTDSYQKSRIVNARDSIFDNIQQRGTNEKVGSRADWMKKVLERPDPRRMAETASLFRTPSPGTSDRVTQRSGNGGLTRRPLKTVNVESDTKKSARYSDGDAPLNEHDLDSIDLNQDTELSSTITEAYRRRQSERAQKASGKDPLLNESPEPKKTARWPKVKELARQIQEEGSLNEHDLDKIDLNRDAKLGSRATEAYRRPQNERAQNEIEKEPLLNESPEPNKVIEQSTRSGKVVSDLVRDSKLETIIASNASVVRHISYVSNPRMRQRRLKKEETWRRRRKLGSGSFGCVWLEERLDGDDTGRLRAVKEITKSREGQRSEIDYNRELEAIAKFSHSKYVHCFVQSFGWYESENTIFITMEYIEKGDLQSYLVRPFPEEEVKQIAFQLLEGLEYMHENGFAHRDLKPANILVSEPSPNWWVKISDFGISKRAEEATAYRTFVGTRGYLAPEILGIYSIADMNNISSSQTLDDSSSLYTVSVDLWALGATMYRLLTNEILFGDPRDLAKYVAAGQPFPRAIASELGASEACVDFLENIMARSPNSRPSSSEALRHPWLSELQDPVDTTIDALEELQDIPD